MQPTPSERESKKKNKLEGLNFSFAFTSLIKAGILPKISPIKIDFV